MANTYIQFYFHIVFAVKNRDSLIKPEWRDHLYKYISGIVQNNNHKLISINGTANHLHLAVGYRPHQLLPELMQDIKGFSSRWINEQKLTRNRFSWQAGYGAFSVSPSRLGSLVNYVENQENHHRKKRFRDEYLEFLKKYNIAFDEKYLPDDIS